jgi:hypothetical protein
MAYHPQIDLNSLNGTPYDKRPSLAQAMGLKFERPVPQGHPLQPTPQMASPAAQIHVNGVTLYFRGMDAYGRPVYY